MAEYQWSKGSRHKVPAQKAGEAIEKLTEKHGGSVTADDVVTASRSKRAPLHPEFEWDDKLAGHEYRKTQGGAVLRHLVLIRPQSDQKNEPSKSRAFELIVHEERRGYKPIESIMTKPKELEQVIERARREYEALLRRYRHLSELAEVHAAIEKFLEV